MSKPLELIAGYEPMDTQPKGNPYRYLRDPPGVWRYTYKEGLTRSGAPFEDVWTAPNPNLVPQLVGGFWVWAPPTG